jgi:ABC-type nitrate/sulfonate/bicarbonate transport system substrate-binding protein
VKTAIAKLSVASCCLVVLIGCEGKRVAGPPEKITLALSMLPHASLVHVAVAKGYFAGEGLEVTLQPHQFGKPALDAMLAGKADLATCADTPLVFAVLKGQQISVLATIAGATRNTAVVARKDAGISTPRDLAGKRVGVSRGTNGEFFLDTLLVRHGVDRESVHLVDLSPADMPDALAKGEVDAVAIWNPIIFDLQRLLGDRVLTFYADDIYFETFDVVARMEFAKQRPGAAKSVLRALLRAEALVRDHPDEARRATAAALKQDLAQIDATFGQFDFRVRLEQSLLVLMEEEARWAIRSGLVPRQDMPNLLTSLETEPLLAVKPAAVQLVR